MQEWIPLRDEYLAEALCLEGRGDCNEESCSGCKTGVPAYRCIDCFGLALLSQSCCVKQHSSNPLHRITVILACSVYGSSFSSVLEQRIL